MKIGIAQIACRERRIDLNIKNHFRTLNESSELGCRYVLFPELSLTGYFPEQLREYSSQMIKTISNDFSDFALKKKINFTLGAPIWRKGQLMIGAITFMEDGRILQHEKSILYGEEHNHVVKGDFNPQFQVDGYNVNLCICAELTQESLFAKAKVAGANIYAVSALLTGLGYRKETDLMKQYASQGVFVLFANHPLKQGTLLPVGGSTIWNCCGQPIAIAGPKEQLLVVDCDIVTAK